MPVLPLTLLVLALAGCAAAANSADEPALRARGEQTMIHGANVYIESAGDVEGFALDAQRADAWPALLAVYREDLQIPKLGADPERWLVGNPQAVLTGRLGGERMSRYFRCGSTLTGPIADQSQMRVSIVSELAAAPGGGSVVRTQVGATAQDRASGSVVACASTGELEQRVAERLRERLAAG